MFLLSSTAVLRQVLQEVQSGIAVVVALVTLPQVSVGQHLIHQVVPEADPAVHALAKTNIIANGRRKLQSLCGLFGGWVIK